jgi:hypothetical protein
LFADGFCRYGVAFPRPRTKTVGPANTQAAISSGFPESIQEIPAGAPAAIVVA